MNTKSIFGSFVLSIAIGVVSAFAQDVQTRSIPSDDFQKKRPAPRQRSTARLQRSNFNLLGSVKNPAQRAPKPKRTPPKGKKPVVENYTDIGVTVWKLRPAVGMEEGYMMRVQIDENKDEMWLSERVRPDSLFAAGDRVRFAIEATIPGYLYVFDRQMHADGTFGIPAMIFPAKLTDDNYVAPGLIADIPDHRSEYGYFDMKARRADHSGEFLTVIVSPTPLRNLLLGDKNKLLNPQRLTDIEADAETEIFTRDDTADKIFSKVESDAACGTATRDLERVKTAKKPCADAPRLSPDDAPPQSVYRVKNKVGQPAVIFVRLATK